MVLKDYVNQIYGMRVFEKVVDEDIAKVLDLFSGIKKNDNGKKNQQHMQEAGAKVNPNSDNILTGNVVKQKHSFNSRVMTV